MRISIKLTIAIALSISAILLIFRYIRVQREISIFEGIFMRDHQTLAQTLATAASVVADRNGFKEALHFIKDINLQDERFVFRWVPDPELRRQPVGTSRIGKARSSIVASGDEEHGFMVTRLPLRLDPTTGGEIELRASLLDERNYRNAVNLHNALITLVSIVVSAAVILSFGWWFVGRPMRLLVAKLRRVGEGDLGEPLRFQRNDEMTDLAKEINAMCERLTEANERVKRETTARIAAIEQLRHADRLSTVGRLASGIAHELGTPLNVVSARAKMIFREQSKGKELLDDARVIAEQSDKMANIIRQLLDFARRRPLNKTRQDVGALAAATLRLLEPLANKQRVQLELIPLADNPIADVDGDQIQQALTNLVLNAVQAQPNGGAVRIRLEQRVGGGEPPSGSLRVIVEDDGPGFDPELRQKVFEPFFTTKDVGEGTGLGLSVAYGIVQEHGGELSVESIPGAGSRFTMKLPRVAV